MNKHMPMLTCRKFRQVFLLLRWIPKKKNALESNGLVGTKSDANTQVVTADDLNQPGVLRDGWMLGFTQLYSIYSFAYVTG